MQYIPPMKECIIFPQWKNAVYSPIERMQYIPPVKECSIFLRMFFDDKAFAHLKINQSTAIGLK